MSDCFSCGLSLSNDENALLRAYKTQFDKYGISRYYYRLSPSQPIKICRANSFNTIFDDEIKPNFPNGAEFAHISEYL